MIGRTGLPPLESAWETLDQEEDRQGYAFYDDTYTDRDGAAGVNSMIPGRASAPRTRQGAAESRPTGFLDVDPPAAQICFFPAPRPGSGWTMPGDNDLTPASQPFLSLGDGQIQRLYQIPQPLEGAPYGPPLKIVVKALPVESLPTRRQRLGQLSGTAAQVEPNR